MKSAARVVLLSSLWATMAFAQNFPHGVFKHIIIIVQENRTPDNLFGAGPPSAACGVLDQFEPGVDIVNGGMAKNKGLQCTISLPMNDNNFGDPNHFYTSGWIPQYDSGAMDGFCQIQDPMTHKCLQYSFIQKTDVQPYFDLATNYGFANYMFQTNEGPSFPAHQFLFTGTSAPVAPLDQNYQDFVSENGGSTCSAGQHAAWVDPTGSEGAGQTSCYTHDSLVTAAQYCSTNNCDRGISWRYYAPNGTGIWTAPSVIPEVCYGQNQNVGGPCGGTEWDNHVVLPSQTESAPILNDIASCNLAQISWVIPDARWSDHHGDDGNRTPPLGPSWVGDIVDAVGNSWANSNHHCDYWGGNGISAGGQPTAIFVVWDDWGGWFDHVLPPAVYRSSDQTCDTGDAPNGWGCGYTYGFRVPLLVVSEFTPAGYISGPCQNGSCQNNTYPYRHDFGSILAFTANNFGLPSIAAPYYADYNAPDWDASHQHVPLSDFFDLLHRRTFTNISTPYPPSFFEGFYADNPGYQPTGPDGDSD